MTQQIINAGDHSTIKRYPRLLSFAKKEEAECSVKEMVENGIIEESSGTWASPIVLVEKKDRSIRFCVDCSVFMRDLIFSGCTENARSLPI
ncbi:hypothetical protein AVEN_36460-1 [Araneus ventricosus]|uniref:Transposon Ty3-I Gag-Pol polyprotein n=1 Tax=Araneus ventricosus TaxID=182803 RepID=A0A4Y2QX68_ARAVE|nr:hypothetical protein AVEN_36460-1 [Araneus ventricosus]